MSNRYQAPAEVRQIEKMFNEFTYLNGYESSRVFDDWLEYIICAWSFDGKPIEGWKYKEEGNKFFYDLLCEWVRVLDKQMQLHKWYDAFGDLYMACVASKSRKQINGQFFTPPAICDLMASIS